MHGIEHRFWFQNGAINCYVDQFWFDLGVTFGAFSVHFEIFLRVLGGSPAILTKSFQKIEKNTSKAPSRGLLERKLELLGAKMAAKSAKMGQHDRQDGHFGMKLAASGSIWGVFWSHLGKQARH